jgi:hypothetical protein
MAALGRTPARKRRRGVKLLCQSRVPRSIGRVTHLLLPRRDQDAAARSNLKLTSPLALASIPSLAGGDELLYFFVGQFVASLLCCVDAAVFDAYRDTGVGETGPTGRLRKAAADVLACQVGGSRACGQKGGRGLRGGPSSRRCRTTEQREREDAPRAESGLISRTRFWSGTFLQFSTVSSI